MKTIQYIIATIIVAMSIFFTVEQLKAEVLDCQNNPVSCAGEAPTPEVLPAPQPAGPISSAPVVSYIWGADSPERVAKIITDYYPTQEAYDQMVSDRWQMEANYFSCGKYVDSLLATN